MAGQLITIPDINGLILQPAKRLMPFFPVIISGAAHIVFLAVLVSLPHTFKESRHTRLTGATLFELARSSKTGSAHYTANRRPGPSQPAVGSGKDSRHSLPLAAPVIASPSGNNILSSFATPVGKMPVEPPATVVSDNGDHAMQGSDAARSTRINPDEYSLYLSFLRSLIDKKKEYPESARVAQLQGTATLQCSIQSDGKLLYVAVKQSSGYRILDNAAIRAIRSVGVFPAAPPGLLKKQINLEVAIDFQLSDNINNSLTP